jgi:hypothetical protein
MSAPRHSIEQASRALLMSQMGDPRTSPAVTAVSPADTGIIEVPYLGRNHGAVQVAGTFVGTVRIQGTLLGGNIAGDANGYPSFLTPSTDADYVDITPTGAGSADITTGGIYQIPAFAAFSRIRVKCTAFTSGSFIVRVL